MLVLTRKASETIWMDVPGGEPICITTIDVHGGRVRLALEAPAEYRIHRDSLPAAEAAASPDAAVQGTS